MITRGQCVSQLERATLVRNGTRWQLLVNSRPWRRIPIDDLFMGDRIQFAPEATGMAVLRVVLTYGRIFRDACAEAQAESLKANYEVQIDASCPHCGDRGAHAIEITAQEVGHCGPTWPMTRCCASCERLWSEEASFPQLFYDELLAAIQS